MGVLRALHRIRRETAAPSVPFLQVRSLSPLLKASAIQYTGLSQTLKPQITGQTPNTSSPLVSRPVVTPAGAFRAAALQPPQEWDVTAEEKANSDRFFKSLDTTTRGYIEGDVAVPFMLQSNFPQTSSPTFGTCI